MFIFLGGALKPHIKHPFCLIFKGIHISLKVYNHSQENDNFFGGSISSFKKNLDP